MHYEPLPAPRAQDIEHSRTGRPLWQDRRVFNLLARQWKSFGFPLLSLRCVNKNILTIGITVTALLLVTGCGKNKINPVTTINETTTPVQTSNQQTNDTAMTTKTTNNSSVTIIKNTMSTTKATEEKQTTSSGDNTIKAEENTSKDNMTKKEETNNSTQQSTKTTENKIEEKAQTTTKKTKITPKPMQVTSPAFTNGGMIPNEYTCKGTNINPQINISNVPAGTKSIALIMNDPDAPAGVWDHWLLADINPKTTVIAKNSVPTGATQGYNSWSKEEYGGPCPPSGTHRYMFNVYALDTILSLPPQNGTDLLAAMQGHILKQVTLMGKFSR